jgi:hypothetical protein
MVMSKVSKAIAASFLCLLFNASGNVTNAMEEININTNTDSNVLNRVEEKEKEKEKESVKSNNDDADDAKDKDDKTPDGEKSIWRWLLPVITGVGGTTVGIVLGKFAF